MFPAEAIEALSHCTLCPRECGANRFSELLGYCRSDAGFNISAICNHKGEEPVISGEKGICNIFFSRCNLQCLYCQNHEISRNTGSVIERKLSLEEIIAKIKEILAKSENIVGFVSPSHFIPHVRAIITSLREEGLNPVFVYNSNGYDKVESLQSLEGYIDVYLPDFKYMDTLLAKSYSQAGNYPEIASKALQEMIRQKGTSLRTDERGIAESGIIIRHLVLPNAVDNSIKVLRHIAEEFTPKLHISLMAQYYPTSRVTEVPSLNRTLTAEEYFRVTEDFHELGFYRGWIQELESQQHYRPSFQKDHPFE